MSTSFDVQTLNRPTACLTERGTAVNAAYKLLAALRELPAEDRRDCLELLEMEIAEHALD